jgi:dephospho-CoA kinase
MSLIKKVGLTGGIGSGKSTVANIFKILGIPIFDADSEAKKIMEQDANVVAAVTEKFGADAYTNGKLNRAYIANIVFNNAYQLQVLNAITHPATINAFTVWAAQQTAPYIIKEAALLFEAGTANDLEMIIGVTAPQALRIQRVMHRDGITREAVLTRMDKQISDTIKMRLCDEVITNNEQQLVITQVLALHEKLIILTY